MTRTQTGGCYELRDCDGRRTVGVPEETKGRMEKVRINDLARELEVKSEEILDLLPKVGVTEKKTHSSSIEPGEAEKVRRHFSAQAETASSAKEARAARPAPGEIKTKIDLSKISKPGDVLKAITKQTTPPPAAPRAVAPAAAKPAATAIPTEKPAKPATPAAAAPAAAKPAAPAAAGAAPIPAARPPAAPATHAAHAAAPASAAAGAPARRMIRPQTGPRPVYQAPAGSPRTTGAGSSAPMASGRPAPGRPVPGQPIFQRPRPAPAARPPLRPASAVRCILRGRRPQERARPDVRWAAREWRRPRDAPWDVRAARHGVRDSATSPGA